MILYFVNFILTHINMSRFWLQSEEKLLVRLVMHRERNFIIMADFYHLSNNKKPEIVIFSRIGDYVPVYNIIDIN
jgi:hypothetical protein